MQVPIRLAVVGGSRGAYLGKMLATMGGKCELAAVCDRSEEVLARWKQDAPEVKAYSDFQQLIADPDIDAVFIATPLFVHAQQAVAALKAGKHVVSEVIAAHTIEDCWELVETVEQTGLTYMMAENYCYMRDHLLIDNMVKNGLFGDITHVEGGYIHDVRLLFHDAAGELTWRGDLVKQYNGATYPTHSMGPMAQWLGINRGDELDELITVSSLSAATAEYFAAKFSAEHPGASRSFWSQGDHTITLLKTKKGVLITLRVDIQSNRPHNIAHHSLQGTKGAYLSPRYGREDPLVWFDGISPGTTHDGDWEPLWNYAEQWEHPLWKRDAEHAAAAGHGGGDFFVLREFVDAILEQRRPAIDVYDAVTWSAISPLSVQSAAEGGAVIKVPDFRRGRR